MLPTFARPIHGVRSRALVNGRRTKPLLFLLALATMVALASGVASAFAAPPKPPPPTVLPKQLSLDQAMQIFHERGLDLLIAEANVASAEADVTMAGAVPNPSINGGIGKTFGYDPNAACGAGTPSPTTGCSSITW